MNKKIEVILYNLVKKLDSDSKTLDRIKNDLVVESDKIKEILYTVKEPTQEDIEWAEWIIKKKDAKNTEEK